jgi:hypothetical protein
MHEVGPADASGLLHHCRVTAPLTGCSTTPLPGCLATAGPPHHCRVATGHRRSNPASADSTGATTRQWRKSLSNLPQPPDRSTQASKALGGLLNPDRLAERLPRLNPLPRRQRNPTRRKELPHLHNPDGTR